MSLKDRVSLDAEATEGLVEWCRAQFTSQPAAFDAECAIARRLGAQKAGELVEFGFWTPELLDHRVPDGDVFLEILTPVGDIDLTRSHQAVAFERVYLPVMRYEAHTFACVSGVKAGTRDEIGDFGTLMLTAHDMEGAKEMWLRSFTRMAEEVWPKLKGYMESRRAEAAE